MTAPRAKRGFALPAVLAIVAIVTLAFLVAILALRSLSDQTREAVEQARFETVALSLEAHAAYAVATGAPERTGVAVVGLGRDRDPLLIADGRPYGVAGAPGLTVSAQDEAGLINLDTLPPAAMGALFAELDVPADRRAAMTDRLGDFLDMDDLARIQGAETSAYLARGLAPPPNGPLGRVDEVLGVLDWKTVVSRPAWLALRDGLTADPRSPEMNVNTAPPATLRVLFGFNQAQIDTVLEQRQRAPFATLESFGRAAGTRISGDAERVYGFPNGRFVVKIASIDAGLDYRARIVLTPHDSQRPVWREDAMPRRSPSDGKADRRSHAPLFPDTAPGIADPGRPVRGD